LQQPIIGNQKALAANLAGSGLADPDRALVTPHHSHTGSAEKLFIIMVSKLI